MAAPCTTAGLLECVAGGRYEDVLGVTHDADREQINRAHVQALFCYRGDLVVQEALNRAKGLLADETPLDKARRLLRLELRVEALQHLERVLDDPRRRLSGEERAEAHHLAGWALFQLERYREALGHLEHAANMRGHAADEIWLGSTLERLGQPEQAQERYRRAVALRGHAAERLLLCNALMGLGRLDEALACFVAEPGRHPDLDGVRRELDRRRRRARIRVSLARTLGPFRHEPLDWLLAGLTLVYGAYFFLSLIR